MPIANMLRITKVSITGIATVQRFDANRHRWVKFAKADVKLAREALSQQYTQLKQQATRRYFDASKPKQKNVRLTISAIGDKIKTISRIRTTLIRRYDLNPASKRFNKIIDTLNNMSNDEIKQFYENNKEEFATFFRYKEASFYQDPDDKESRLQQMEASLGIIDRLDTSNTWGFLREIVRQNKRIVKQTVFKG